MAFVKHTSLGIAGVLAYLGRKSLARHYVRGMQHATDWYIIYVGGAMLAFVSLIVLNAFFLFMRWHGAQATLAIVGTILSLYYLFAPRVLVPLTALSVASQAATPGDQPNALMVRDGLKSIVTLSGVLLFSVDAYIVITMLAPFHLFPEFFYLLHVPLLMSGLLLMTGYIPLNVKVYEQAWWASVMLVVAGVLVVMIGRERLLPIWAEVSAKRSDTVVAELNASSITQADRALEAWIKKHVRINAQGSQVVTVKGADGKEKEVDAAPYIARERAKQQVIINAALGKGANAADFWTEPGRWIKENPVKFVILLLLHYPIVWLWKRRTTSDTGLNAGATTAVATNASSGLTRWIILALLGGGTYAFWDDPRLKDLTFRGDAPEVKMAPLPIITPYSVGRYEAVFTTKNIHFPLPQHAWHGQKLPLAGESYANDTVDMVVIFDTTRSFDIKVAGTCVKGTGSSPRVCAGQYDAGQGYAGLWRGEWSIGGHNLRISLFKEDRNWETGDPIAEILVRLRSDG